MASTWRRRTQQERSGWKARFASFFCLGSGDFPQKKKEEQREIVFFCLFKMDIVVCCFVLRLFLNFVLLT